MLFALLYAYKLKQTFCFQALDYTGKNLITVHNALLLFKEYHEDAFSIATWSRFLSSRPVKEADVYFDEIRLI